MRYLLFLVGLMIGYLATAQTSIDQRFQRTIEKADSLRRAEQFEAARDILLALREAPDFSQASCLALGNWYHKLGVVQYYRYANEAALAYWRDSALVTRQACAETPPADIANSYYAVALAYRDLYRTSEEREAILQSVQILEQLEAPDPLDIAYKYQQVGQLFNRTGDVSRSLFYLEAAQRFYDQAEKDASPRQLADLYNEFGLVYTARGRYNVAIDYLQKAATIHEAANELAALAVRLQNISKAHFFAGRYAEAEQTIRRAFAINEQRGALRMLVINYQSLGNIVKRRGQLAEAMAHFQAALQIAKTQNWPREQAAMFENIGDVQILEGQIDAALDSYQEAIISLVPGFTERDPAQNPEVEQSVPLKLADLLRVLRLKGEAYFARYQSHQAPQDLRMAYETFRVMDDYLVGQRQGFQVSGSKFLQLDKSKENYERAIQVALAWYEAEGKAEALEQAYNFAAKNKAIVLLEDLQDLKAKIQGVPPEVLAEENALREQYSHLERQLARTTQDSLRRSLSGELFSCRRSYEDLIARMEQNYPDYYALKYALPQTSDLQSVLDQLPADRAVIEYFVGEDQIYTFILHQGELQYHVVDRPGDLAERCERLYAASQGTQPKAIERELMSDLLLKKVLETIGENVTRLTFIPDGPLLKLSFDFLPHPTQPQRFLIEDYAVSLAYSQQLLFAPEGNSSSDLVDFGGFGLEYDDFTLEGLPDYFPIEPPQDIAIRSIGKLIYSDDEVQEIAEMLGGSQWINNEALKSTFLSEANRFRILHFAMHSLLDPEQPLNSCLVFSRPTSDADFLLYASELYNLQLPAELVVLSACNTGTGQIAEGEGIRSLARAFAYAGAPSLVASLWSAPDYSTKNILLHFYQALQEGHPKDVALQMAKQAYLHEAAPSYQTPQYWAHLQVIGDTGGVALNQKGMPYWQWGLVGLLLLGLILLWRRKG